MVNRQPYVAGLPLFNQGKVRDTFKIPGHPNYLLVVATDAISTHNVSHLSLVPGKGQILTALSLFWLNTTLPGTPTHIVGSGMEIFNWLPQNIAYPADLHLRAVVVKKLHMLGYEFIYRARMAGSLWKSYQAGEPNPYGLTLPEGLQLMSEFEHPIFTPTEKSETDDPISSLLVEVTVPRRVHDLTRSVYHYGRAYALSKGIDIIDCKEEVGMDKQGFVYLADEWLNGDCCRFVRVEDIQVGIEPPWADKEIFRQAAVKQWGGKKSGPPLEFSPEVIEKGIGAYHSVFEQLTDRSLSQFQKEMLS